jgi:hypothetical protein
MEPKALQILGKHSITELHPQSCFVLFLRLSFTSFFFLLFFIVFLEVQDVPSAQSICLPTLLSGPFLLVLLCFEC